MEVVDPWVEESDRKFQDFWREESEEFICGDNVANKAQPVLLLPPHPGGYFLFQKSHLIASWRATVYECC